MKKIVLLAMGLVMSMTTFAQDEIETTVSADIVSSYIWRGQDLGSAAVQPTLGIAYKGLSLSAWGNYGLVDTNDAKEFDLTLAYTIGGFNVGISDYWFDRGGLDPEGRYFKYDAHGTNHVFEANVGYDFGFASLQWFTNFAGNDYKVNGKRAYSSYVEVGVPFKLAQVECVLCIARACIQHHEHERAIFANGGKRVAVVAIDKTRTRSNSTAKRSMHIESRRIRECLLFMVNSNGAPVLGRV